MPSNITRAHCQLDSMVSKPPKRRTLHAKARKSKKDRGQLKDVVIKVHKVPEHVKNMHFQHDRSQKPALEVEGPKPASPLAAPGASTSSKNKRKRTLPVDRDEAQEPRVSKKQKAEHTSASIEIASPSRKRKASGKPENGDEGPAHKKSKTPSTAMTVGATESLDGISATAINTGNTAPKPDEMLPFALKDDGTPRIGFLHLAAEIRNNIYSLAMSERLNLNPRQAWGNEHPLQRTCKLIRAESNYLFHNVTRFQTSKLKHVWKFLHSRTKTQKQSIASLRITTPIAGRVEQNTLRNVRRTLYGFKHTFSRKGLKDSVVLMQMPVYDPDNNTTELHWVSVAEIGLYETMSGRRRNAQGGWALTQVTVVRATDEAES